MSKKKVIAIIVGVVVLAGIVVSGVMVFNKPKQASNNSFKTANPTYANISDVVIGSGTLVYNEDYTINSKAAGQITACNFADGDKVTEGQILYTINSDTLDRQIQQARISLEQAKNTREQAAKALNDLNVKSYTQGMITNVYIHNGDFVQQGGKIADVTDSQNLILKVPFNTADIPSISIGQQAVITLSATGGNFYGNVNKIYSISQGLDGGKAGTIVEISAKNPGAIKQGDIAFAKVGDMASVASGSFENKTQQTIVASSSGQVENLSLKIGDFVSVNQSIVMLKNDTMQNNVTNTDLQIKSLNTTITQLESQLSDYVVASPIDGLVTSKINKKYDNYAPMTPMAIVSDNTNLYAKVDIDELNIQKVKLGQIAKITTQDANAVAYSGVVDSIADVGIPKNGVTYYTVKIKLDNKDVLMVGMNVDVGISTAEKQNVLTIPTSALKDNKVRVLNEKGVQQKQVTVGIKDNEKVEILSGLGQNDKVIVGGNINE